MITKLSEQLKKDVRLQPHQQAFLSKLDNTDGILAYHGLGSGKTLSSIAGTVGRPSDVVVPASLRENYKKEVSNFVDKPGKRRNITSYEGATGGGLEHAGSPGAALVVDEVQRTGNSISKRSQVLRDIADKYEKRILLSGTPAQNHPSELAPIIRLLNPDAKDIPLAHGDFNTKFIKSDRVSPGFFNTLRGVKAGVEESAGDLTDLRKAIKGRVHYQPSSRDNFPDREDVVHRVEMSPEQQKIYKGVTSKSNPILALKVRAGLPLNKTEVKQLNAFMTAARQVSNTSKPYGGKQEVSPKMQKLIDNIAADKDGGRHVVYSNYIDSGLTPIQKQLQDRGIPLAVFTGKQNDKEKKQAVDAYNSGKLRALLLSSAGAEGIDLKGTKSIHLLEPHWNDNKLEQVIGRGIRFGSHEDMPEKDRKVTVNRYQSVFPKKFHHRFFGKPDEASDEYLDKLSKKKQVLLGQFLDAFKEEGLR